MLSALVFYDLRVDIYDVNRLDNVGYMHSGFTVQMEVEVNWA